MPKTRGMGLLMLWCDVDPEHEAEFNRWYDEEHIKHLTSVPGFLDGGRYVAIKGGPKYLAMYELEDHNVLKSAAFLDEIRYRPSARRQKTSGGHVGRNYILNAYRQIFPMRASPIEATKPMPPYLQMGRIDIPAAMEEEFNAWYNTAYIPRYLEVPGVLGARRFVVIDGQPKYLTVYDFERADVPDSREWMAAHDSNPWSFRVRPHLIFDPGSPGVYRRVYPS
jgi:hypothetical protein